MMRSRDATTGGSVSELSRSIRFDSIPVVSIFCLFTSDPDLQLTDRDQVRLEPGGVGHSLWDAWGLGTGQPGVMVAWDPCMLVFVLTVIDNVAYWNVCRQGVRL
jgi:hypothetical protein